MTSEANAILEVFREKGLKADGFVHFTDFGSAIVWEAGFVRDEPVREAMERLISGGYLVEFNAGLRLTQKGEAALYPPGDQTGAPHD